MSVQKTIEKATKRDRLVLIYGEVVFVEDCEHAYDEKTKVCSKCKHHKTDWGCITQVQCDRCKKYSCRRCNEVRECPSCEEIFCDDCVKKRYCVCKTEPYCENCLTKHGGYCSALCRREDRSYDSEADSESNFNSEASEEVENLTVSAQ